MANAFTVILTDPNLGDTDTDRDIREWCASQPTSPSFADPSPADPRPNPYIPLFTAGLAKYLGEDLSVHRRMARRLALLATLWS